MNRKKNKKTKLINFTIWILVIIQMAAWLWLMTKGGKANDTQYLYFSISMILGQIGASVDCIHQKAWPTLIVQIFFLITTIYGLLERFII